MAIKINKDCMACGMCEEICDNKAIFMSGKKAEINQDMCKHCGMCLMFDCPAGAIVCVNESSEV